MLTAAERIEVIGEELDGFIADIQFSYWIEFREEDLIQSQTVGELFDCMVGKRGPLGSPECLSRVTFHRLRRSVMELTGAGRKVVRPDSDLTALFPARARRRNWKLLQQQLRGSLPPLLPGTGLLTFLLTAATASALTIRPPFGSWIPGWGADALWTVGVFLILLVATKPLHLRFPGNVKSAGQLVRLLVTRNQERWADQIRERSDEYVWAGFREKVAAAALIPPDEVRRDMLFPEDLLR